MPPTASKSRCLCRGRSFRRVNNKCVHDVHCDCLRMRSIPQENNTSRKFRMRIKYKEEYSHTLLGHVYEWSPRKEKLMSFRRECPVGKSSCMHCRAWVRTKRTGYRGPPGVVRVYKDCCSLIFSISGSCKVRKASSVWSTLISEVSLLMVFRRWHDCSTRMDSGTSAMKES